MFKSLKSLSNHPAVSGVSINRSRVSVRYNGFPIVVNLKPGFWNARHAVNVVMGHNAAEVLSFFNDGSVKRESDLTASEREAIGIPSVKSGVTMFKSLGVRECNICGETRECFEAHDLCCAACYADGLGHGYEVDADGADEAFQENIGRTMNSEERGLFNAYVR